MKYIITFFNASYTGNNMVIWSVICWLGWGYSKEKSVISAKATDPYNCIVYVTE